MKLVGGYSPSPRAPPRSKRGRERKKQKRCRERSNYQRSDEKKLVGQVH